MMYLTANGLSLAFGRDFRALSSMRYSGRELLADRQKPLPLENGRTNVLDSTVYSTAWESNGKTVQLFANYTDEEQTVTLLPGADRTVLLRRTPEVSETYSGPVTFTMPPRSACAAEF